MSMVKPRQQIISLFERDLIGLAEGLYDRNVLTND